MGHVWSIHNADSKIALGKILFSLIIVILFLSFIIIYTISRNAILSDLFYWLILLTSLVVSLVLISKSEPKTKILFVCLFFIACAGLYIFSFPIDIISNYYPSHYTISMVKNVCDTGYHVSEPDSLTYVNYPGLILFGSVIKIVTSVNSDVLFKFLPLALLFLSTSFVLKGKNSSFTLGILFTLILFNPYTIVRSIQFAPPFFAIILLIFFFILLQKLPNLSVFGQRSLIIIILLVLLSIVIYNITWATLLAFFLFFYSLLTGLCHKFRKINTAVVFRNVICISLVYFVFFSLWYLFAHDTFTGNILTQIKQTFEMISNDLSLQASYITPVSAKPTAIISIQYIAFLLLVIFGALSFFDKKIPLSLKLLALGGIASSVAFMGYWFLGAQDVTDLFSRGILLAYLTSSPMIASHITKYFVDGERKQLSISKKTRKLLGKLLVVLFLALTMLNAVFFAMPPDVYDFKISPTKESARLNLTEWVATGNFLLIHSNVSDFYGVKIANNLLGPNPSFKIKEYSWASVNSPENISRLNEIAPDSFHLLRTSMDVVPEFAGGIVEDFESVILHYNVIYVSGDPVIIYVPR